MWAKKNAMGKEGVAKLVDDTYRSFSVVVLKEKDMLGFHCVPFFISHNTEYLIDLLILKDYFYYFSTMYDLN